MNFATHIQISKSCHYLDLYPKHTKSRNRGHCYGRRKVEGRKTWSYEICLCGNLSKNDAQCQALDVLSSAWQLQSAHLLHVRDEVGPLLRFLDAGKDHLGSGNVLLRVDEVLHEMLV